MSNPYRPENVSITTDQEEGGYLVPNVISIKKRGMLGWIARLFNHPYGWKEFRFADELLEKTKYESIFRKFAKDLPDDYEPPIPISTRTGI